MAWLKKLMKWKAKLNEQIDANVALEQAYWRVCKNGNCERMRRRSR